MPNTLTEFSIKAVTEGIDAVGEVTIRIQPHNGDREHIINPQTGEIVRAHLLAATAPAPISSSPAPAPT